MDVVGVHGIGQQQLGRRTLLSRWHEALLDGVEREAGYPGPDVEFDVAFYGDLFLPAGLDPAAKGASVGVAEPIGPDEAAFLAEFAAEQAEILGTTVAQAEKDAEEEKSVLKPLRGLLGLFARRVDPGRALACVPVVRQVWQYLTDDELAKRARTRVKEVSGTGCRVLVGHSLGSVVAYEALALGAVVAPEILITLGSPLASKAVRKRLRGGSLTKPDGVRSWVNVADPRDPVAVAGTLAKFGAQDREVKNGSDPHSAVNYLRKKETGSAVLGVGL
ncbi:hypothetical protein [Amycolatopsis tolypomycina]|uniref:hypothetical protein n=1 Tax=Amycolatopsis tolypomycina TaxID=208445 RepID=UPI0033A30438